MLILNAKKNLLDVGVSLMWVLVYVVMVDLGSDAFVVYSSCPMPKGT